MTINKIYHLKLMGKTKDDIPVISAHLQDSIVSVKDIFFLKNNRNFIMLVKRFMWEDIEKGVFRESKRIRCLVKFGEVIGVKSKNINQKKMKKRLECLMIKCNQNEDKSYKIDIFFSGGRIITLISEAIDVIMEDLGKTWDTKHIPVHKI